MQKTWYSKVGSKKAELWTILHFPYTAMCLSFLIIGFGIHKPIDVTALILISIAYLLGLGIAAHSLDQLKGMGTSYIKFLSQKELLTLGIVSLIITTGIGIWFITAYNAWLFLLLVPIQTFFAISYPIAKLFNGFFHTDFWFAVGFGFMPVVIGYYSNTLTLAWIVIPFGVVCFLIALIEITLSRYVRDRRKEAYLGSSERIIKPERALKLLCLLSYALAAAILLGESL